MSEKIVVPEPPPGIGSGFLTEYWQQQQPLPRIRGFELAGYFMHRGLQNMVALPMSNAITIMTIGLSLFMLAGFLLLLQNVNQFLSQSGGTLYVTAYIREGADEGGVRELIRALEADGRVRAVQYVSKESALRSFREDLGSRSGFLAGLENDNPLPASLDVVLQPDELGINSLESTIDTLKKHSAIEETVFGSEWVERLQGVLRIFRFFGGLTLFIALGIIVFLISNTIKLVIYSRRDEISIMSLVGASNAFVKVPFIISGLLQGLIGAVLGLVLLKTCFLLLSSQIHDATLFGVALPDVSFLNTAMTLALIILGLAVGAVGSFFALAKVMKA